MPTRKATSRSFKLKALAIALPMSILTAFSVPASAQTVTAVLHSGLRVLDPVITTAYISRNHGYMIYDTLLATNGDNEIQPQMAERWDVSDDGKTYTFTLRDGLAWHDGNPVTSEDCIASIERWAAHDKMGQVMLSLIAEMKVLDDKTFSIEMTEPTNLALRTLAKASGTAPFMMPKRIAETPAGQAITEHIGSGPFTWVADEFQPGLKAVYAKNVDYVPRTEPASGNAGGKIVHVDRVEWVTMPDQMTSVNALMNGEIDFIEQVPYDLLVMLEGRDDISTNIIDKVGYQTMYRFNFLQPPFDNKQARQAAMYAVGQENVMQALVGNPEYYQLCPAQFGCGMPYESDTGADMLVEPDIEKAKALLKESNYDGTPVLVAHPTDVAGLAVQPVVIAEALRAAGFAVNLQAMDWQTLVNRRTSKRPIEEGGWNIFATNWSILDIQDPVRNAVVTANGDGAWFGWPEFPEIEALRHRFALSSDEAELNEIAEETQRLAVEEGLGVPLGQYYNVAAYTNKLTDIPVEPIPFFWGLKKAD